MIKDNKDTHYRHYLIDKHTTNKQNARYKDCKLVNTPIRKKALSNHTGLSPTHTLENFLELIVFDLDGTLLNDSSQISSFTRDTLLLLQQHNIAYTVATGRTLNSAQTIIEGHGFVLPHIYSNGVMIWNPNNQQVSLDNCLTTEEVFSILKSTQQQTISPFISAVGHDHQQYIFHGEIRTTAEQRLLTLFQQRPQLTVLPIEQIPLEVSITNVSMIGHGDDVDNIHQYINQHTHLIAYSGPAIEGDNLKWMDIHHSQASKGHAVNQLRKQLEVSRVICFGDSDNDLSMFASADESYAMSNANREIQTAASDVIGHHHEDGVAHFLRERFAL